MFLDLSKAFDTLDHELLLRKLSNNGLNQSSIQWFNSYLSNRSQSVCTNGTVSDPEPILQGVPQGSVLGPFLFIIYVNDLPSIVKYCCVEMYADDTLLYFASSSVNSIESNLSADLANVIQWLNSSYLHLNYSKTKVTLTGTHQRLRSVTSFNVCAQDKLLERVYKFKYLDVFMDPCNFVME